MSDPTAAPPECWAVGDRGMGPCRTPDGAAELFRVTSASASREWISCYQHLQIVGFAANAGQVTVEAVFG